MGRALPAENPQRSSYLQQTETIFAQIDAAWYLNQVRSQMQQPRRAATH